MTRSTCIGFLSLPQFTGPEGEELLTILRRLIARYDRYRGPEVGGCRPPDAAIGIYYIRDMDRREDDPS